MAPSINPGYTGLLTFNGGQNIRCSSFGMNVNQEFEAYNHALGLNDFVLADNATKFELPGIVQKQKVIVRPKPFTVSGSISFPLTDGIGFQSIFEFAKSGAYIDTIDFQYFCSDGGGGDGLKTFRDCRVDSMSISVTAGDFVNVTMNVFAMSMESAGSSANTYTDPEKLITWDVFLISIADANVGSDLIQSFTLDIKNNVRAVHTAAPNNAISTLGPRDLRLGTQDVSGTVSVYGMSGVDFLDDCSGGAADPAAPSTINILVNGVLNIDVNCLFFPRNTTGQTSVIVSSIPFMGVDYALGQ